MDVSWPDSDSPVWHGGPTRHVMTKASVAESCGLIQKWLYECDSNHEYCKKYSEKHQKSLPKRVIDVGREDNTNIHIFQSDSQQPASSAPYVALSHCWGRSRHLVSEEKTIDRWRQNIPWTQLPRTFQEAIAITRALGIQYIWIDSLCIIQDDISDWEIEAGKMGMIYSNAFLIIAAVAAKDGDGGIFVERPASTTITGIDLRQDPFQVFARISCAHSAFTSPGEFYYQRHSRHAASQRIVNEYPLFGRAWCFQERVLGTKVLHFTTDEIVFDCLTSTSCECGYLENFVDDTLHPSRRFLASIPQNDVESDTGPLSCFPTWSQAQRIFAKRQPGDVNSQESWQGRFEFDDWYNLVSAYSSKSITRASDWLPALGGLASKLSVLGTGSYFAGLWADDLLRGLLWVAFGTEGSTGVGHVAPSWSWASTRRAAYWVHHDKRPIYFVHIDVQKSGVNLKGLNPFGEVSCGWLFLTGEIAEVTLVQVGVNDTIDTSACVEVSGIKQTFTVDNREHCASLVGQKVVWLKYCQDGGFERALILANASEEQAEDIPSDIRAFQTTRRRIGIVEFVDKSIELVEPKTLSMYVV